MASSLCKAAAASRRRCRRRRRCRPLQGCPSDTYLRLRQEQTVQQGDCIGHPALQLLLVEHGHFWYVQAATRGCLMQLLMQRAGNTREPKALRPADLRVGIWVRMNRPALLAGALWQSLRKRSGCSQSAWQRRRRRRRLCKGPPQVGGPASHSAGLHVLQHLQRNMWTARLVSCLSGYRHCCTLVLHCEVRRRAGLRPCKRQVLGAPAGTEVSRPQALERGTKQALHNCNYEL